MLFREFLDRRVKGGEKGLPLFFHDKEQTYQFCKENDIRTVEKIAMFDDVSDLNNWLKNAPEAFVIKPSFLSSALGVMVLTLEEDGQYFDGLSKKKYSIGEIFDIQSNLFNKSNKSDKFIVIEEKIEDKYIDGIPLDYKVYIFLDKIAFIGVYNRNHKNLVVDWFDENMDLVENGIISNQEPYVYDSTNPISIKNKDKKVLIDFAKAVSKKIKLPFVSLDLYLSEIGPVLGEVTLSPGGLYYQKMFKITNDYYLEMDEMLNDALNKIG